MVAVYDQASSEADIRLPPPKQTGSAHLKSDEVVSLLLYSS
ncbi:hypothetical protein NBRC106471_2514 [Acetobacter pasteurianus subsp. pasteurianus LMG 1262 = NBRC 106471]|nr:hypothetical protein NBRC106471_2514 [Acetobacter pasteurianus subsp. pasteurianus LMG 1262 = NBRC 106471]